MPRSEISPNSSEVPRWGQCSSSSPTLPCKSRKTTSSSPRIVTRRGTSRRSSEKQIGCQKRRRYSPQGVPGPVCVSSLSSAGTSRCSYAPNRLVRNGALELMTALLVLLRVAPDEIQGGLGAAFGVSGRRVKRVAGNHQQLRSGNRLLPGARLLHRGQAALVGGDHERRAGDL